MCKDVGLCARKTEALFCQKLAHLQQTQLRGLLKMQVLGPPFFFRITVTGMRPCTLECFQTLKMIRSLETPQVKETEVRAV